ncbi:DNA-binding response regulator [Nocardioides immobilis]|uniref:DNA-binding response regulator n=1 Tax=Nocardioides immobilis TaxID=2049295 RepID=A0A417Y222_9ACTN|nr:response regulator transcription factor [Nocardioides immobilis]RHW26636.1 DNA-binding response regulator [Nocardioides immobilis]
MISVVLAEDHGLVREGLRAILDLQDDIEVVAEATDGVQALSAVARHRPDVLVLDIQMPRLDGLEVVERIASQAGPGPAVLMLTTFDRDDYVYRALKAGAAGFLLKDVPRSQLLHAIRLVAQGDELLSPSITRKLVERFLRGPQATGLLDRLTAREREVLELVGHGLNNREIADRLSLGEATVKTHLGSLFSKCGLRDRAQAVVLAYESGLVTPGS